MRSLLHWSLGSRNESLGGGGGVQGVAAMEHKPFMEQIHFRHGFGTAPITPIKRKRGDSQPFNYAPLPSKAVKPMTTTTKLQPSSCVQCPDATLVSDKIAAQPNKEARPQPSENTIIDPLPQLKGHENVQRSTENAATTGAATAAPDASKSRIWNEQPCAARTEKLRDVIEGQFSLEILMKHNELRLIDQEMAKCQVALEQLRRCRTIPYPATSSRWEDMQAVSSGSGTVRGYGQQQTTNKAAQFPPPWGVTDGPYARHYRKWLLPDAAFDGPNEENQTPVEVAKQGPLRAARAVKSNKSFANVNRSQRGSTGSRLMSLPAGYAEPKETRGPMIVTRPSDGKMVKLVCLDCNRDDFNSTQGFINHCRIQHSRSFATHDAAKEACGKDVEYDGQGAAIFESNTAPTPVTSSRVHPLIKSTVLGPAKAGDTVIKLKAPNAGRLTSSSSPSARSNVPVQASGTSRLKSDLALKNLTSPQSSRDPYASIPFVPSAHTPHLSALFARSGRGGNLDDFINAAKEKVNLDEVFVPSDHSENEDGEEEDDDVQMDDASSLAPSGIVTSRLPVQSQTSRMIAPAMSRSTSANKGPNLSRGNISTTATTMPMTATNSSHHQAHRPSNLHANSLSTVQDHSSSNVTPSMTALNSPTHLHSPTELSPGALSSSNYTNAAPSLIFDEDDEDEDEEESGEEDDFEDNVADDEHMTNHSGDSHSHHPHHHHDDHDHHHHHHHPHHLDTNSHEVVDDTEAVEVVHQLQLRGSESCATAAVAVTGSGAVDGTTLGQRRGQREGKRASARGKK